MISLPPPKERLAPPQRATPRRSSIDPWGMLARRWPWILLSVGAGVGIAWCYAGATTRIYESRAEVVVIQKDARIPAQAGGSNTGFAQSPGEDVLATHMQILASPRIVQEAVSSSDLSQRASLVAVANSSSWPDSLSTQDRIVRYILSNLRVRKAGDGATREARVVRVAFQHTSPEDCRDVLAAIIGSYESFVERMVQDAGDSALRLIHNARHELKQQVTRDDTSYRQYVHEAAALITDGETLNPHQAMLQQFENQLADVRLRRSEAEARRQVVAQALQASDHEQRTDALLAVIGNADLGRLNLLLQVEMGQPASEAFQAMQPVRNEFARAEYDRLWSLRLEALEKSRLLGAEHPKRQELDKQVAELEKYLEQTKSALPDVPPASPPDMAALASTYLKLLTFDLSELERREAELIRLAGGERESAKQLVEIAQNAASLYRNLQNSQLLYEKVVDRLGDVNLARDYAGFITEVIAPAQLGDVAWPNRTLLLAFGMFVGGAVGVCLAGVRDLTDRRFRDIQDVELEMSLPVLAHIPPLPLDQSRAIAALRHSAISCEIVAHHCPDSNTSDEFRELRSAIHFQCRATAHPIIQVTSATRADGKSMLVANLAASFAQMGNRVLIVDCDLRRPRQHELLGVAPAAGIGAILNDSQPLETAIVATQLPKLQLVPGDANASGDSDQLSSTRIIDFLASARDAYDIILLDTPPVLESSDPLVLASCADYTLLVLRLEKQARPSGTLVRNRLLAHGARLLGLVINAPTSNESRQYAGLHAARTEQIAEVATSATVTPPSQNGRRHRSA